MVQRIDAEARDDRKNTGTRMIVAGTPSRMQRPRGTKTRMVTSSTRVSPDESPRSSARDQPRMLPARAKIQREHRRRCRPAAASPCR